ncbi:MAG TPA: G5 domain-containing protein [Candidatus Acidoferrum sp.]|nr:G5 domain-containing protein [Candidatus Acidoferrum sp.]
MGGLFALGFLIAVGLLVVGVLWPRTLRFIRVHGEAISRKQSAVIFSVAALACLVLVGIMSPSAAPVDNTHASATAGTNQEKVEAQAPVQAPAPTITTKQVSETQDIPFTTQTQDDDSLPSGQTTVVQTGKNGVSTLVYEVTYTDGKETSRKLVSQTTTTPVVAEVVHKGTHVDAPTPTNDPSAVNYYVNVDGQTVESPDANTAGATGVCNDGTYTKATHHQGACSHHGGVNHWL